MVRYNKILIFITLALKDKDLKKLVLGSSNYS